MTSNSSVSVDDRNTAYISISAPGLQIVRRLLNAQLSSLHNLECDVRVGNEIDELVRLYLQYHFDGLKPLKSMKIFQQQLSMM